MKGKIFNLVLCLCLFVSCTRFEPNTYIFKIYFTVKDSHGVPLSAEDLGAIWFTEKGPSPYNEYLYKFENTGGERYLFINEFKNYEEWFKKVSLKVEDTSCKYKNVLISSLADLPHTKSEKNIGRFNAVFNFEIKLEKR